MRFTAVRNTPWRVSTSRDRGFPDFAAAQGAIREDDFAAFLNHGKLRRRGDLIAEPGIGRPDRV